MPEQEENDEQNNNASGESSFTFFEELNKSAEFVDQDYKSSISYVRDVFKYFKKSPLKLSELEKLIKAKDGKELALLLDVKTRWNSLLPMIQRYLRIKLFLKDTLEVFNDGQRFRSVYDDALNELVDALKPIEEAVIKLSSHKSNIMIAEAVVKFISENLNSLRSSLARDLGKSIVERYNSRRNKEILSLLLFLHTGAYPISSPGFEYSDKKVIKATASSLFNRLFPDETTNLSQTSSESSTEKKSLQNGIDALLKPKEKVVAGKLDKDIQLLEASGEKSLRLEKLYKALLSIQSTSTSCEQAFSVAGSFKTKIRNRLSPEKLSALCWLKSYFIKKVK